MLNVFMLSDIMLTGVMLCVILLKVVMLSVVIEKVAIASVINLSVAVPLYAYIATVVIYRCKMLITFAPIFLFTLLSQKC